MKAIKERKLIQLRQQSFNKSRTVDESINWIKSEFYIPELNGPIELHPYQEAVLREAYRKDSNGNYIYSLVVWSDIKKGAKSTIAAARAMEQMSYSNWGSVKIIGNDIKQADSRTAFYARRAAQLNPRLAPDQPDGVNIIKYKIQFHNNAVIEAIPIDPEGEAGGNDDLIIYTEAWGLKNKADLKMWEEQRISPTKFGKGQIWVESYAGYVGESPILETLYEYGVTNGINISEEIGVPGLEVYRHGTQLTLWNTVPRLPWQTPEYYASESASMTPESFQRVHRNQWVSSLSKFVPDEWWESCRVDTLPDIWNNQPMILVADAGVSNDCFGLLMLSRHDNKVAIRYTRKWTPPKGGKLEYVNTDDPDDVNFPEGEIRRLNREYNIVQFAYDPYQLHDMSNRVRNVIGINSYAFNQGEERSFADKQFYDMIREKRVMHTGESDLTEHVHNANQKAESDKKLRIVKRSDNLKIDLCVCGSMGSYQAIKLNI